MVALLAMDLAKILVVAHVRAHVQAHQNRLVVAVALVVVLATVGPVAPVVVLAVVVVGVVLHVAVIAREHAPLIAGDLVIEEIAQAGVPVLVKLLVQELVIKAVMILAILHVMTLVG